MRLLLLLVFVLLSAPAGFVQAAPGPPDTLRRLSPERRLAYTYANDLFFRTDYYFTQGMTLTLVHPVLARLPVRHLLARPAGGGVQHYGVTLRYDGFTPLRIQDAFIRVGDRPHAAYGYASFFRVSSQPAHRQRLTTALELGFIGPAAGGKQLQTFLHQLTGNAEPRGWNHQISNDAILGYRVAYEKQLLAAPGRAELLGTAEASLSTLYTYAGTGLRIKVGRFAPGFGDSGAGGLAGGGRFRPWQLYGLATLESRFVGYDATLQGGVFNRSSPYTLAAADVRRAVLRSTGGLVLAHGALALSATATWLTPEFAGGRSHRWGQLGVAVEF